MYLHTNTGLGVNLSVPLPYSPTQEHPYSLRERERERVPSNNSSSGAEGGREAGGSGSGSGGGRERERERTTSLGAGPSGSVSKSQRTLLGTRPPPLSNSRTLRPIAMDDMVLTPTPTSSHGHGHEYAEEEEEERERERKERERMNRRGSVDEVSLVANTRRRNAELDDDVPPLPSEGQSSSASVTYYSFPNGSSGSAKPGRSIPSMWLGAETRGGGGGGGGGGLEREGSKKVRFNTTSSGGLMHMTEGGAGAGNGGGLLNSGIQKWKSMLMNQRRKSELAASLRANAGVGGREGGGSGRFSFSSRD
ncbi:hypothetical protein V5O48_018714 [Marasmius crinis-equi]|uniref:Uncharacterized protein n=1 Tax=Marasmius crinis-equi TaxID=585013 RepID=A0ABR3EKI8_9AGAR